VSVKVLLFLRLLRTSGGTRALGCVVPVSLGFEVICLFLVYLSKPSRIFVLGTIIVISLKSNDSELR